MAVRLDVELTGLRLQFSGAALVASSLAALARIGPVHGADEGVTDVDN